MVRQRTVTAEAEGEVATGMLTGWVGFSQAVTSPPPDEKARAWERRSARGDAGGAERPPCRPGGKGEMEARGLSDFW